MKKIPLDCKKKALAELVENLRSVLQDWDEKNFELGIYEGLEDMERCGALQGINLDGEVDLDAADNYHHNAVRCFFQARTLELLAVGYLKTIRGLATDQMAIFKSPKEMESPLIWYKLTDAKECFICVVQFEDSSSHWIACPLVYREFLGQFLENFTKSCFISPSELEIRSLSH